MPETVRTEDVLGGDPRFEGHRIGGCHVYQRYVEGDDTPGMIAISYGISVDDVRAALAYAFSYPEEMRSIEIRNRTVYDEDATNRLVPHEADQGPSMELLADGNGGSDRRAGYVKSLFE